MKNKQRVYALCAAEPSGDLQASALVPHLRQLDPEARIIGIGGRHLAAQGVELLCDTSCWGSIGPSEVVARLPRIIIDYYRFRAKYAAIAPDVTVMIDSPALFMRMAKYTKKLVHQPSPNAGNRRPGDRCGAYFPSQL